jgi:undecaprenyl pyrophosphate synthase
MWPLAVKWFLGGGWKTIVVGVVVGGLIASFGFLYGAWQIEKGQSAKYRGERDAAKTLVTTYKAHLNQCLEVNRLWEDTAEGWNRRVSELTEASEAFRTRLSEERARRRAAEREIGDITARIDSSVTSPICENALDQLIAALGWGGGA